MTENFKDKVAIVTGGASGMGRAVALRLGECGVKVVVVTANNVAGGEETVHMIKEKGGEATFVKCDISVEEQVQKMVEKTVELYGGLDFAFNNAGAGPDGVRIPFAPLTEFDSDDFRHIVNVNLCGLFYCLKYEIRQMKLQGRGGSIVNTSSTGGIRMVPEFGSYGPSKAAVNAITQTAALENGQYGIRVNAVCPGPTLGTTLMDNKMASGGDPKRAVENMSRLIPLQKPGSTTDVANAVLWLFSDWAGHTTGQYLSVDGGMHAK